MANAKPVTKQETTEQPAPADERLMEPVAPAEKPKAAPKVDPKELEAEKVKAEKEGKKAFIVGNAVRVDN
jgi:hypothetical protein